MVGVCALLILAVVAGCSAPLTLPGSDARVAVSAAFSSYNAESSYGRASAVNGDVALLTGGVFGWTEADGSISLDPSFGRVEIVQAEPFIVRYEIADGVEWSDGVPVSSTDLLLAWAANSGALNDATIDPAAAADPDTGRLTGLAGDVYFDGRLAGGIAQARVMPQVVDARTLLVRFESRIPDWRLALAPGIPAHVLARTAGLAEVSDPGDADAAASAVALVRSAIESRDAVRLGDLSRSWNLDFDLAAGDQVTVPPSAGPYLVNAADSAEVVLVANPGYTGARQAKTATITLIVSADPMGTMDLVAGHHVDVADLPVTAGTVEALSALPGIDVRVGLSARAEHLELRFTGGKSGVFGDPGLREAFLLSVPRQAIVGTLFEAVAPDIAVLDSFTLRETDLAYRGGLAENGSEHYADRDLDRARELVAHSRVEAPEVCILFDPADARRQTTFALIAQSAGEAGFHVTDCSRSQWQEFLGVNGAYDAALYSWDTARLGREGIARVFQSSTPVANLTGYADPAADALIAELAATDDPGRTTALLHDLDRLLWSAAYGLPLYTQPTLTAVTSGWDGLERSPLEHGLIGTAWRWSLVE